MVTVEHQAKVNQVPFQAYVVGVSVLGFLLALSALNGLPGYQPQLTFILLLGLVAAAQVTMTFTPGVQFSVGSAISLATVPLFGPLAAALVAAVGELVLGLIGWRVDRADRVQALRRVSFNIGMHSVALTTAGLFFQNVTAGVTGNRVSGLLLAWFAAAVIADQMNMWLLIGVLHLQHGTSLWQLWHEQRWASPINILVMVLGGGILALAVDQFDLLGIGIFFLPILVSAYAFRAYASGMQEQMEKLEDMVALRTQALTQANKKLEDLHREKDAFLAVLTHDMRTPLTSIAGFAHILQTHPELPVEKRARMAEIIMRSQQNLLEMVNNILDIEQLQTGMGVDLERTEFDLGELCHEVADGLEATALERAISLVRELPPERLCLLADRAKIKRVITNLLSNAVKYTPDGGRVTIRTGREGHQVVISVQDTGYGIPEEELPRIFERFRRVREHQRLAVGTGLGLAIVQSLVQAHNGEVTVTSKVNQGSTFTVRLPA